MKQSHLSQVRFPLRHVATFFLCVSIVFLVFYTQPADVQLRSSTVLTNNEIGKLGRLGNQLFQLSSLVGLSRTYNTAWRLPKGVENTSVGALCSLHGTLEDSMLENVRTISEAEISSEGFDMNKYISSSKAAEVISLSGYFQDKSYFDLVQEDLKSMCFMPTHIVASVMTDHPDITHHSTVAIHVRRGDYMNLPEMFDVLNTSYFFSALQLMKPFKKVIVASDDISWCRRNLNLFEAEIVFLDSGNELYDFIALSLVPKMVMSNSTFSWWAAYLRKLLHGHKLTVAPFPWYKENGTHSHLNSMSFYLEEWILMSPNGTKFRQE